MPFALRLSLHIYCLIYYYYQRKVYLSDRENMSNYTKLKTNLKIAIQRLKLVEKKKTELSLKARKEIADYLAINKPDRAKIRVEHIIREDNEVEAMET